MAKIIIPCPVAENGTKTAITAEQDPNIENRVSYDKGIPDICAAAKANGGQPPRLEDFNYLFYLLSNELFELQRGIQYTFQSGISYNTGAVLWYPAGKYFVRSKADNNTESDLTNTTYWEKITVTPPEVVQAVPPGVVQAYAGDTVPAGWLLCNGQEVSRTTYSALFSAIGTTYGAGDESTTFNVPDFRNRTFWGGDTTNVGAEISAGLPDAEGTLSLNGADWTGTSGMCSVLPDIVNKQGATGSWYNSTNTVKVKLSAGNSIYGASDTVQPPAIQVPFIIKY